MTSLKTEMQKFKDSISKDIHGMTRAEAHEKGICVDCKKNVEGRVYSEAGRREYQISGMCELCFDELMKE